MAYYELVISDTEKELLQIALFNMVHDNSVYSITRKHYDTLLRKLEGLHSTEQYTQMEQDAEKNATDLN